jgi:uncharacterized membrane protein
MTGTFRNFSRHPAILALLAGGIVVGGLALTRFKPVTAGLLGWCAGVVIYLGVVLFIANRSNVEKIKSRAERLDEGRVPMLVLTIAAALTSVVAIVVNLALERGASDGISAAALAGFTVVLSWFFVHTVFTLHYAHEFYLSDGGLEFPGNKKPDYWEFAYLSFTVGMTAQVSDVCTKGSSMRRLVLAHSVVSFFFNTSVLALGVNLAASLMG